MTLPLPELQRAFAAGVFDNADTLLPRLRAGTFPPARHLQVYRHNTFVTLTDALGACYPVTRKLVGEDFFGMLADTYIRGHPPRAANLHTFGSALPEFVSSFEPARSLPYLAEVAGLEWAWQESYHAAEADALTPAALAAVAPEDYARIVFRMHPSTRLLECHYPCLHIWQVNQEEFSGEPVVNLDAGGERLLVVRPRLDVAIVALGPGEHALLRAFADGENFDTAADLAVALEPEFDLGAALHRHIAGGAFAGIELAPPPRPGDN